jgi:hypothetical protein
MYLRAILVGNPNGRGHLEDLDINIKDNIKMDVK